MVWCIRTAGCRGLLCILVLLCPSQAFSQPDLDYSSLRALSARATGPHPGKQTLGLEVYINGVDQGMVITVQKTRQGLLTVSPSVAAAMGLIVRPSAVTASGQIDLNRLPEVSARYDEDDQTLEISASDRARVRKILNGETVRKATQISTGYGAVFDYSLTGSGAYGVDEAGFNLNALSGSFSGRLYSPEGYIENEFKLSDSHDLRRLQTFYTRSDPDSLITTTVGDLTSGAVKWSRSSRLAGIQIQRDFDLRPDLVTVSVPEFSSSAAVPSSVEVYLNNVKRYSRQVASGPFSIVNLPAVNGSEDAQIVVTDKNGQQTVTHASFYVSDRLLRPGLLDYSLDIGVPRIGYGTSNDHYQGAVYGAASVRYGLRSAWTLEGHSEIGADLMNVGAGVVGRLGRWGAFSMAGAGSKASQHTGSLVNLSGQFQLGNLHLNGRVEKTFDDFADISSVSSYRASTDDDSVFSGTMTRFLKQASASWPIFDKTRMGLSYADLETVAGTRTSVIGSSLNHSFGQVYAALTTYAETTDDSYGAYVHFSLPLDRDNTIAAASLNMTNGDASLTQSVTHSGNGELNRLGWSLSATEGASPKVRGQASIKTSVARVETSLRKAPGAAWATATVSGSVVATDGDLFFGAPIDDAFAIVDAGAPDVGVMREFNMVAKTGSDGKALVDGLHSYQENHIQIDPMSLPLNANIDKTQVTTVPAAGSGVILHFGDLADERNALIQFVDAAGKPLPMGATGRVETSPRTPSSAQSFMIGYGGQGYVTGLQERNTVLIRLPDDSECRAHFTFALQKNTQVHIHDVSCLPVS